MLSIFFSPRGTTKKTARAIVGHDGPLQERDLLGRPGGGMIREQRLIGTVLGADGP